MGVTDKITLGYTPTYEAIAARLLTRPDHHDRAWTRDRLAVLEIGVQTGAGMDYLSEIFNTSRVYGVDIGPEAGRPDQADRIIICPQEHAALPMVVEHWGPFDVIVDDASHQAGPTAVTLHNMWPLVAPGGCYVIEDWNYFEGPGVWQNLWQKVLGQFLSAPKPFPEVAARQHPYSGVLRNIRDLVVSDGMIVITRES